MIRFSDAQVQLEVTWCVVQVVPRTKDTDGNTEWSNLMFEQGP